VRLWVDDLVSFRRIWPTVDTLADTQELSGVRSSTGVARTVCSRPMTWPISSSNSSAARSRPVMWKPWHSARQARLVQPGRLVGRSLGRRLPHPALRIAR
jgi:hypothetical protein